MRDIYKEAGQKYLEQQAQTIVTGNFLKLALLMVSCGLLGSLGLAAWTFAWARNQKPLIVRIDEVGRATAVNYAGFAYKPEAPEIRYFLGQFVQLHFSRLLGSVEERYGKSLFYLDARLSQAVVDAERREESLQKFIREGAEEVDIEIRNIVLSDLRSTPMKAAVDFDKIYFPRGERRELRRETFTATIEFVVQGSVPNSFVLVNPLGLTVTYFRLDGAFKE